MSKHGTPSEVSGSYIEFQAAVLRALPRDIDPSIALSWVNNGGLLKRHLREVLGSTTIDCNKNAFPIMVNYDRSITNIIKIGDEEIDRYITPKNFPTIRRGTANIVLEVFRVIDKNTSINKVFGDLEEADLRPADLQELLAFGEKYPYILDGFSLVALGSLWLDHLGNFYAPFLYTYHSGCTLSLVRVDGGGSIHRETFRFAAIRKSS